MKSQTQIAERLREMVHRANRGLALDALLKGTLGFVFTVLTFAVLFWFGSVLGFFFARQLGLPAWQFGALFSGLFLAVATWSASRRVDPLAGVPRMTDRQWLLTIITQASPMPYFSPRHASAGAAMLLIGGPAGIFQAIGIWAWRMHADAALFEEAARVLAACQETCPVEHIRQPAAALLLRRLALIKVIAGGKSTAFTLTEKGLAVLSGTKKRVE